MKATYVDHMGTDLSVVNAARVSFAKFSEMVVDCEYCKGDYTNKCWQFDSVCNGPEKKWVIKDNDIKLIKYLAKHNHKSPFNHTYITLHIKAPIFVARQLVKHKFMPWNEVSRRYVDVEPEFYTPEKWRLRAEDKKQGSKENEFLDESTLDWGSAYSVQRGIDLSVSMYYRLLKAGVCPEQARMVLPLNTYTEWYWSGTLGAWSDMYNLRSKEDTQWETRQIALECGELLKKLYPVSWKALTNG